VPNNDQHTSSDNDDQTTHDNDNDDAAINDDNGAANDDEFNHVNDEYVHDDEYDEYDAPAVHHQHDHRAGQPAGDR
jgi:hypothetical protein